MVSASQCLACAAGTFSTSANAPSSLACTLCAAGLYGTATAAPSSLAWRWSRPRNP
jgi:hypothetical protein